MQCSSDGYAKLHYTLKGGVTFRETLIKSCHAPGRRTGVPGRRTGSLLCIYSAQLVAKKSRNSAAIPTIFVLDLRLNLRQNRTTYLISGSFFETISLAMLAIVIISLLVEIAGLVLLIWRERRESNRRLPR